MFAVQISAVERRSPRIDRPPNILLILVDDLGYGDLASFGARDLKTPYIDSLVSSGVRLDRFYANCTVCSPTRASILTGRYPDLVGVPGVIRTDPRNSWGYLSPNAQLLPQLLHKAGYHSGIVGKWHLGLDSPNTPTERGFDSFHGFLGDMMDNYFSHRRHGKNYMRRNLEEIDPPGHATDVFTRWAIEYLAERDKEDKPFFLYLAYNAPHVPIQPPNEWFDKVRQRDPAINEHRAKIVALIEHLDDGIGQVLAALKAKGQYERTAIFFTSDNGGQLSAGASCGSLRGGKEDHWEGGIRVPFAALWPGHTTLGPRPRCVALTMDLCATIADLAGMKMDHPIDGVSLLPILLGEKEALDDRDLFWMRREGGPKYQGRDYYAVRRGPWKLLQNSAFEPYHLYNLDDDPKEEHDVAAQNANIFLKLSAALANHLQMAGQVPWQKSDR